MGYWDRSGKKIDPNIDWNLNLNDQLNERTVLTLSTDLSYQAQPDVSTGVGAVNEVGNYLYSTNKLALGFQWTPRIATFTNYSLTVVKYDDSALGEFEDRLEHLISEEIRYLLKPSVVALLEYQIGYVDYLKFSANNSLSHYFRWREVCLLSLAH